MTRSLAQRRQRALVIPSLGVQRSWHNTVQPIASLTKLMTAYVVLKKLPLSQGETGPCIIITPEDVSTMTNSIDDQSSVAVASGERSARRPVEPSLVHSASN